MFAKIKSWFCVNRENARLRKELKETKSMLSYMEKSCSEYENRAEENAELCERWRNAVMEIDAFNRKYFNNGFFCRHILMQCAQAQNLEWLKEWSKLTKTEDYHGARNIWVFVSAAEALDAWKARCAKDKCDPKDVERFVAWLGEEVTAHEWNTPPNEEDYKRSVRKYPLVKDKLSSREEALAYLDQTHGNQHDSSTVLFDSCAMIVCSELFDEIKGDDTQEHIDKAVSAARVKENAKKKGAH